MEKLTNLSFLVVDDNQHMLSILRVLLRAFGVTRVHECQDAASAFATFRATAPDIIIVDYEMAPANGIDFTRRVRRSEESPNPYIPIIMLTAHSKKRRVMEARDAGVTEILVKPVTAKDLLARVQAIVYYPRPFINVPSYFGPCRRRKLEPGYRGPERRKNASAIIADTVAVQTET